MKSICHILNDLLGSLKYPESGIQLSLGCTLDKWDKIQVGTLTVC